MSENVIATRKGVFHSLGDERPDGGEQPASQEWSHLVRGELNYMIGPMPDALCAIRWHCGGQGQAVLLPDDEVEAAADAVPDTARTVRTMLDTEALPSGTLRDMVIEANRRQGVDFQPGAVQWSRFLVTWPLYSAHLTDEMARHLRNEPAAPVPELGWL